MKPQRVTLLAAACAMLLLIGCASIAPGPSASTAAAPTSPSDNPTAGAIRRATSQAQATADSRATADQQRLLDRQNAATTATAEARATAQAIVGTTTGWPVRIQESFADNQRGWPTGLISEPFFVIATGIAAGHYNWTTKITRLNDQGTYTNVVPATTRPFGDFSASVTLQFDQRSADSQTAYGLVFRQTDQSFGFFGLMPSGLFLVAHNHGPVSSGPLDQSMFDTQPPVDTQPGVVNRLTVVGIGSDFVFLVNNQVVNQMNLDLPAGSIGLGVQALQSPDDTQADFTNLSVSAQ